MNWVDEPISETHRQLSGMDDDTLAVECVYIPIDRNQVHIVSVTTHPDYRNQGLGTAALEILMTRYKFFSAEPMSKAMKVVFGKIFDRPDVTAYPRIAKWRDGKLLYISR